MRALAHPTRLRMMHLLRMGPASASELARQLGIRYGSARFHLGVLSRAGFAVAAGESYKRGGRELLFTAPKVWVDWDPDVPADLRSATVRSFVRELESLLDAAAPQWHREEEESPVLATVPLRLGPGRARQALSIMEDALVRIEQLQEDGPDAVAHTAAVLFFRNAEGRPDGG